MKVLVTGANGFLGSWMVRRLNESGVDVRVLCRPTSDLSELEGSKYEIARGDVTRLETVETACEGVDAVFHFAGLIAYKPADRGRMEEVNVGGTRNVIEACLNKKVGRLINISSVMAIGASFDGKHPLNEDSIFNLSKYDLGYAETKLAAEMLVKDAVLKRGLDAVNICPGTVYGPGDARKGTRSSQVKVAQGRFPFYTSGGVNISHVEDVVAAIETAWRKGRKGERYILGGENVTIKQAFHWIAEFAGVKAPMIFLPDPVLLGLGKVGDLLEAIGKKGPINSENARVAILYHWFDVSKAQRELSLKITPARQCLESSVQWMKDNGILKRQ